MLKNLFLSVRCTSIFLMPGAFLAAGALLGGCGGGGSGPSSGSGAQTRETLVFQSDRGGDYEIYTAFGDGRTQLRLTNNAALDSEPALSPDQRRIAFISDRGGQTDLYLMNANGTGIRRLTNDNLVEDKPAWNPNGTQLAFRTFSEKSFSSDIALLNVATGARRNLTGEGESEFVSNNSPTWSLDGTRIAYSSDFDPTGELGGLPQIYVRAVAGGEPTALTTDFNEHLTPAWSPDGAHIAYVSNPDGTPQLFVMRPDGRDAKAVTTNGERVSAPAWSPDSKRLIFSSEVDGNFDLYSLSLNGGTPVRLTTDPAVDDAPSVR